MLRVGLKAPRDGKIRAPSVVRNPANSFGTPPDAAEHSRGCFARAPAIDHRRLVGRGHGEVRGRPIPGNAEPKRCSREWHRESAIRTLDRGSGCTLNHLVPEDVPRVPRAGERGSERRQRPAPTWLAAELRQRSRAVDDPCRAVRRHRLNNPANAQATGPQAARLHVPQRGIWEVAGTRLIPAEPSAIGCHRHHPRIPNCVEARPARKEVSNGLAAGKCRCGNGANHDHSGKHNAPPAAGGPGRRTAYMGPTNSQPAQRHRRPRPGAIR